MLGSVPRQTSTPPATSRKRPGCPKPACCSCSRAARSARSRRSCRSRPIPSLGAFVAHDEAVRAVRALKQGSTVGVAGALGLGRELFAQGVRAERSTTVPLIVSTSLHGARDRDDPVRREPWLCRRRRAHRAAEGTGADAHGVPRDPRTRRRWRRRRLENEDASADARSARASRRSAARCRRASLPPPMRPEPKPPEPPKPLEAKQLPPVMAPIPTKQAEPQDREGVLAKAPETPPSQGSGTGGGVGSGQGTGLGPGDGTGVGEGSGGGYGGGPFRPGSGVEPPRLLREVKADYTDEARRGNIEGEVELEIVVRRDGTVGDVKVIRGLARRIERSRGAGGAPVAVCARAHEGRAGRCRRRSRRRVQTSLSLRACELEVTMDIILWRSQSCRWSSRS